MSVHTLFNIDLKVYTVKYLLIFLNADIKQVFDNKLLNSDKNFSDREEYVIHHQHGDAEYGKYYFGLGPENGLGKKFRKDENDDSSQQCINNELWIFRQGDPILSKNFIGKV